MIDADKVWPYLWIGSKPPLGPELARAGFHVLVLCAEEYQPGASSFPGLEGVVRLPYKDEHGIDADTLERVNKASSFVAERMRHGRKCLVTCWEGRNRSGLVAGLAMVQATGGLVSGSRAVTIIQGRRPWSLTNHVFADLVRGAAPA